MGKSFNINAKETPIQVGDTVRFEEAVFDHFVDSFKHSYKNKPIGKRFIEAEVLAESFGPKTGVRTLKLLVIRATGLCAQRPYDIIYRHARTLHQHDLWRLPRDDEDKATIPAWWV